MRRACCIPLLWLVAAQGARAESFECLLEPHVRVAVSSPVAGVLEEVRVDRGDAVTKGQVVARLQSGVERAARDLARARADFNTRQLERSSELFADELISIDERDQLETDLQISRLELREAEERLDQRTIRSPIDAVVVDRFASPGEYVNQEEILTLAQIDPLNVEVIVPVSMLGKIEAGQTARIVPTPLLDTELEARVVIVDRVVDAASGTIGIRLEVPNPDHLIPAGIKCSVDLP